MAINSKENRIDRKVLKNILTKEEYRYIVNKEEKEMEKLLENLEEEHFDSIYKSEDIMLDGLSRKKKASNLKMLDNFAVSKRGS